MHIVLKCLINSFWKSWVLTNEEAICFTCVFEKCMLQQSSISPVQGYYLIFRVFWVQIEALPCMDKVTFKMPFNCSESQSEPIGNWDNKCGSLCEPPYLSGTPAERAGKVGPWSAGFWLTHSTPHARLLCSQDLIVTVWMASSSTRKDKIPPLQPSAQHGEQGLT